MNGLIRTQSINNLTEPMVVLPLKVCCFRPDFQATFKAGSQNCVSEGYSVRGNYFGIFDKKKS